MQSKTSKPTHDEIARAAYRIYLERGSVGGHEMEDWLRAEQSVMIEKSHLPSSVSPEVNHSPELPPENLVSFRPLDRESHPEARDQRGSPDRADIRRKTTPFRPAARQTRSSR